MTAEQGRHEAQRRYQPDRPGTSLADKQFQLEDLFQPGGRGLAHAAARLHGNTSAQAALNDLQRAVDQLPHDGNGGRAA